jgi:hypothetical protein
MPIPTPREGEDRTQFLTRCMDDPIARVEFQDVEQRLAVCMTQWDRRNDDN